MKRLPPPQVKGDTPAERMDNALRHIFTVSKDDLLKKEAREKSKSKPKAQKGEKVAIDNIVFCIPKYLYGEERCLSAYSRSRMT